MSRHSRTIEAIAHDLDMVIFTLESALPPEQQDPQRVSERNRLRRELESLRDRLNDAVRDMEL